MKAGLRLAVAALVVVFALGWLGANPAQAQGCTEEVPGFSQCSEIAPSGLEQPGNVSLATSLLDYAFGGGGGGCYFCTFSQNVLVSLASFSAAAFAVFRGFFVVFMPIVFSVWFLWKAFGFFASGSEDGWPLMKLFAAKGGIFFLMWLILLPNGLPGPDARMTPTQGDAPWTWIGPEALRLGFSVAGEVRNASIEGLSVGGQTSGSTIGFNCRGVGRGNATIEANPGSMAFAYYGTEMICTIERTYIVAVAVSLSMVLSAFSNIEFASWYVVLNVAKGFMIAVFGMILLATAVLSMVWMAFAILAVVFTFLLVAAFSPILIGCGFLPQTRGNLFTAARLLFGAFAKLTAYALGLTLTFYLMANVVMVYNLSIEHYDPTLLGVPQTDLFADLREFVRRVGEDPAKDEWIPMTIGSPWYLYILIVMASGMVMTKKVVGFVEGLVGSSGGTEMADSAKRSAVVGGALTLGGGYILGKAGWWGTKKTARGASFVGGGLWKGYKAFGAPVPKVPKFYNPFGAAFDRVRSGMGAVRSAGSTVGQAGRAGMGAASQARAALNAVDDNPEQPR
jgi:hypothetical protein